MATETVSAQIIADGIGRMSVTGTSLGSGSSVMLTVLLSRSTIDPAIRLRFEFNRLANEWKRDTRFMSSLTKMVLHPAYQTIIGMGKEVLPLIFTDLQRSRDHWLWALHAITQEDPAPPGADYATAVDAWIQWGQDHGHLPA